MVNVLSSSGLRIGEAVQIELDGIKLDQDPPTIYLEAEKTKGRAHARYIFISYRAKQVLQEWIDYRTEYAKRASKIGRGYTFDPAEDNRLFPFYQTTFTNKWNLACQKAGFDEKDKTTNRSLLTPHKLRKYFRSQGWSIPDAPEALMGRRSRYNATYAKMLQVRSVLAEEYLRVEPQLSLSRDAVRVSDFKVELEEANRKIEEQARVHREEMSDLESLYNRKILRTEDQVAGLVDQVRAQKMQLEGFRDDFREMLDRQGEQDRVIQDFIIASKGWITYNTEGLPEDSPFLKAMKESSNR